MDAAVLPPVVVAGFEVITADELSCAFDNDGDENTADGIKICVQGGVGLYHNDVQAAGVSEGTVTLSSCAIYFAGTRVPQSSIPVYLRLSLQRVANVTRVYGVAFFSRPKLIITLAGDRPSHTKLSFRQGGIDTFHQHLIVMLEKKHWLTIPVVQRSQPRLTDASGVVEASGSEGFTDRAGVRGLVDRREAREEALQCELRSCTSDLDQLLRNAKRIKSLIAHLRSRAGPGDKSTLDALEARLGVIAPVTKQSTSEWIGDLGAELRSWLSRHPSLGRLPSIPLAELFSFFNGARGSANCVVVADFRAACQWLCEQQPLATSASSWSLFTRADGVVVINQEHVRSASASIVRTLLDGKAEGSPATAARRFSVSLRAVDLARKMHVAVPEATLLLDELVASGMLCRALPTVHSALRQYDYFWNPFIVPLTQDQFSSSARPLEA